MRDSPRSEQFASQLLSLSSTVRRKLIYAVEKIMGVPGSKGQRENVKIWPCLFCDGSNTPARAVGTHIGG